MNRCYQDTLRYYGYSKLPSKLIYPHPIIKQSRTFLKQASLLRLPVPQLDVSLNKYLTSVKPLLNEQEYKNTQELVNRFKLGVGNELQKLLIEKSTHVDNWLAQWWLDKVYLEPRYSVTISVNPSLLYPKQNFKDINDQLAFSTNFIYGFLAYKNLIDTQQLPVEKHQDSFMCMDQYYKIVGTTRVPKLGKDELVVHQPYSHDSKYITVIYKNRIFNLQVRSETTGDLLPKSKIFANLKDLVEKSPLDHGIGILTSENRDVWAKNYKILSENKQNRQNFHTINQSLFVLCLDDGLVQSEFDEKSSGAAQLLHGSKKYSSNRWFDKTIQLIVTPSGICGLNFEHSVAEALPFANLSDFVLDYIAKNPFSSLSNERDSSLYRELNFTIPNEVKQAIETAHLNINKSIDDLELMVFEFNLFGKNFPKSQKISPDAFVQTCMQFAFYKIHKKWANAYESGSLRRFTLGRTEVIRSCSEALVEFLKSSDSSTATQSDKSLLLKRAINAHKNFTSSVLNFESFDKHLLGLKLIALENKIDLPELFKDVAFNRLTQYEISSSQVSSKHKSVVSFGPAAFDGYGICYNIMENAFIFGLSSNKSCKETSVKNYADKLHEALLECQTILLNVNSKL